MIVGFRGDDTNGVNSGRATLFSGIDGSEILSVYGDDPGDWLGTSVDVVGDLDGDNLPDFIVGAFGTQQAFSNIGRARVFSSINGNLIHTIDPVVPRETNFGRYVDGFSDVNGDGTDDLLIFTGVTGVSDNEIQIFSGSNGQFIDSVAGDNQEGFGTGSTDGIGDINQDGIEDFAVGAHQTVINGDVRAGAVNVYSGADRSLLLRIEGDEPELRLGSAISELGDVDGDGYPDFLVSAPANFSADDGQVRIYSGQDGSIIQTFSGADRFGSQVAGLGDLNGDGIPDFIVQNSNGGTAGLGYSQVFLSNAVPEPSVILPAIFGLLSLCTFYRPRRPAN